MNTQRLGITTIIVGVLGCVASVIWWLSFYSEINRTMSGNASLPSGAIHCLISNSGPCGLVTGIANAAGMLAYNPILLWASGAVTLIGVAIAASSESKPSKLE